MRKSGKKFSSSGKRSYTESFRRSVVEEYASGRFTQAQLHRRHGISTATISYWIKKYGTMGRDAISSKPGVKKSMKDRDVNDNESHSEDLLAEIERLKKELRAAQVRDVVQKTMLDIIDEDYDLDHIKKKLNIERLSDYEPAILNFRKK